VELLEAAAASDIDVDAADLPGLADSGVGTSPLRPTVALDAAWLQPVAEPMDLGEAWEPAVDAARVDLAAARKREADATSRHGAIAATPGGDDEPPSEELVGAVEELADARRALGIALARLRQRILFGSNLIDARAAELEAAQAEASRENTRLRDGTAATVAERNRLREDSQGRSAQATATAQASVPDFFFFFFFFLFFFSSALTSGPFGNNNHVKTAIRGNLSWASLPFFY
jgi:hypothetical protein